jgi:rhodanese-related sulfurtransferase
MDHGYAPPPRYAAGHVPNGLPFDFRSWLPAEGRWPEPGAVWRVLRRLGPRVWTTVDLEADFVLYGEGPADLRPALAYLWLRWLGLRARVLPGGFPAWAGEPGAPIVRIVGAEELAGWLAADNPELAADAPPAAVVLLDLREDWDFAAGHLPGAVNLPISRYPAEFESVVAARWPRARRDEAPFVLYCYGRDCVRSRDGLALAARAGFADLVWFRDGVEAWTAAGFPLPTSPVAPAVAADPGDESP